MRPSTCIVALAVLAACRGGGEAPPAEPAIEVDAAARVTVAPPPSSPAPPPAPPPAPANEPAPFPYVPHLDRGMFAGKLVVLGTSIVDSTTGERRRSAPPGFVTWAADGDHLALAGWGTFTLARASSAADDYTSSIPRSPSAPLVAVAANGRSALFPAGDSLVLVDAAKRSTLVLAETDAGTWTQTHHWDRALSPKDGVRAAWVVGATAFARDLDAAATVSWSGGGKDAAGAEVGGDVAAALFGDELAAVRLPGGQEILRKKGVVDFALADDGKAIAWTESGAVVVLWDLVAKRESGRATIADDPNLPVAKQRFRGVCGGGDFGVDSVDGAVVTLRRECSLLDILRIRPGAAGTPFTMESHTPAEDYEAEQKRDRVCKRAKVECGHPNDLFDWAFGGKRFVFGDAAAVAVYDTATGRRLTTLDGAVGTWFAGDLVVAPHGKTLAGLGRDEKRFRLWDLATGKVLFDERAGR